MEMKNKYSGVRRLALTAIVMAACCSSLFAQQLKENVVVDGRYKADIVRREKINMLPKRVSFSLNTSPLSYSFKSVTSDFTPALYVLPATGWAATRKDEKWPGYINLSAGSWLNAAASLGYRFIDTDATTVGIRLQHLSSSLFKAPLPDGQKDDEARKIYDDAVEVFGSHSFDGLGRLDASLRYRGAYFNYYTAEKSSAADKLPTQTLTDIFAHVGWTAPSRIEALNWSAGVEARYFGYRAAYEAAGRGKGTRETDIAFMGRVSMPWESGSMVGLDARADILLYGAASGVSNYGNVSLTPYYQFRRGLLNIHLGAALSITPGSGPEGERYGLFHIAPEVRLDWQKSLFGAYLHATGGTELMTLAALSQYDYYQNPLLRTTKASYKPIDARLGFNFGPFSGMTAGVSVAYKVNRGLPSGGLYMLGLQTQMPLSADPYMPGINVSGISIGVDVGYKYGSSVEVGAGMQYQPQDGTKGYFNGFDRPKWIVDASLAVRPVDKLKVDVSLDWRGKRSVWYQQRIDESPGVVINGHLYELSSVALRDLTRLNLGIAYSFTNRFTVRLEAFNLLNRRGDASMALPGTPTEGINFLAGFGWLF